MSPNNELRKAVLNILVLARELWPKMTITNRRKLVNHMRAIADHISDSVLEDKI